MRAGSSQSISLTHGKFVFGSLFFVVTMLLGVNVIIGRSVHLPLKWCHISKKYAFVTWAVELYMWVVHK